MTIPVLRTTVTAMAALIVFAPGRQLHSQVAADRMEALVQADRSAAAASWKLGLRGALLEASDHDGVLLLPGAPLVIGMPDALRDLADVPSPLSSKVTWDPLGLEISSDSSLALMWGVAFPAPQADAPAPGRFVSAWKYSNSAWKIAALVLQGPAFAYKGAGLATAAKTPPGTHSEKFFKADRDFARLAADSGASIAFQRWAAPEAMMFGRRGFIIRGPETIAKAVDGPAAWSWAPVAGGGSSTGDLGWTVGEAVIAPAEGTAVRTKYLTAWRVQPDGSIRFIVDAGNPRP
jgi:hypothetical protein